MRLTRAWASIAIAVWLTVGGSAAAQTTTLAVGWGLNGRATTSGPPSVQVASQERVNSEVGSVSYEVACPKARRTSSSIFGGSEITDQRGIRVTLSNPSYAYRNLEILSFILDRALERAWEECVIISGINEQPTLNVGWAEIWGTTPSDDTPRQLARAENFTGGVFSTWHEIKDLESGRERAVHAVAIAAQQDAQAKAEAEAYDRARQHIVAARLEELERKKQKRRETEELFSNAIRVLPIIFVGLLLWNGRVTLLRAWYGLTPHPARTAAQKSILTGERLDVDAMIASLKLSPANAIEQGVREEQLRETADLLRAHQTQLEHAAAQRVQDARELAERRAQAERDYTIGDAETDLLKAALEHQTAAARVEALRKRSRTDAGNS